MALPLAVRFLFAFIRRVRLGSNDDQRPQSQLLIGLLRVFSMNEVVLFNCPHSRISA
jgi:hypothetical protein